MNKRQRKKLNKKLFKAVRELNDDFAKDENLPLITDTEVEQTVNNIKDSKESINQTLSAYSQYIKNI